MYTVGYIGTWKQSMFGSGYVWWDVGPISRAGERGGCVVFLCPSFHVCTTGCAGLMGLAWRLGLGVGSWWSVESMTGNAGFS